MAKSADQFRSSDITIWGIVAIACWAVAVLGANVSAVVPASVFAALHSSRLDGGTVNQVRGEVNSLGNDAVLLRSENRELKQRLAMSEDKAGEFAKRINALEVSLPKVIEAQAARVTAVSAPAVDPTETGAIGDGNTRTFEADGGTVAVTTRPLLTTDELAAVTQAMPPAVPVGVAIGFPVMPDDAAARWQTLLTSAGPLLLGLQPKSFLVAGSDKAQLLAGPVEDRSSATLLCTRLVRIGIPCEVTEYAGTALGN